jgi:hypothetical protein
MGQFWFIRNSWKKRPRMRRLETSPRPARAAWGKQQSGNCQPVVRGTPDSTWEIGHFSHPRSDPGDEKVPAARALLAFSAAGHFWAARRFAVSATGHNFGRLRERYPRLDDPQTALDRATPSWAGSGGDRRPVFIPPGVELRGWPCEWSRLREASAAEGIGGTCRLTDLARFLASTYNPRHREDGKKPEEPFVAMGRRISGCREIAEWETGLAARPPACIMDAPNAPPRRAPQSVPPGDVAASRQGCSKTTRVAQSHRAVVAWTRHLFGV